VSSCAGASINGDFLNADGRYSRVTSASSNIEPNSKSTPNFRASPRTDKFPCSTVLLLRRGAIAGNHDADALSAFRPSFMCSPCEKNARVIMGCFTPSSDQDRSNNCNFGRFCRIWGRVRPTPTTSANRPFGGRRSGNSRMRNIRINRTGSSGAACAPTSLPPRAWSLRVPLRRWLVASSSGEKHVIDRRGCVVPMHQSHALPLSCSRDDLVIPGRREAESRDPGP